VDFIVIIYILKQWFSTFLPCHTPWIHFPPLHSETKMILNKSQKTNITFNFFSNTQWNLIALFVIKLTILTWKTCFFLKNYNSAITHFLLEYPSTGLWCTPGVVYHRLGPTVLKNQFTKNMTRFIPVFVMTKYLKKV
jgi:hypothetical protein